MRRANVAKVVSDTLRNKVFITLYLLYYMLHYTILLFVLIYTNSGKNNISLNENACLLCALRRITDLNSTLGARALICLLASIKIKRALVLFWWEWLVYSILSHFFVPSIFQFLLLLFLRIADVFRG